MPELIGAIQRQHPDQTVEVYFQDESRLGQQGRLTWVWAKKGTRPRIVRQCQYQNIYVVGAVCPRTGHAEGLISTHLNTEVTNAFLRVFSQSLPEDVHAALVWDGAGYHSVSGQLVVPKNITLIDLPAYSPELNPVELLWLYLKEHYWSNRTYPNVEAMFEAATEAWQRACLDVELMKSVCACHYLTRDNNS